jgi:intracellular sulfur oxidation DsrE/DsrF family protein
MTVRKLMARGVIMLACNNALNGQAYTLKQKENISETEAQAQLRASVADGVYIMPNGIFSVARAQEAGCSLFMPG